MEGKTYSYTHLRETLVVAESTRRSMQGNRSTGTQPEELVRKALWGAGARGYRKNVRKLPGKPDIVFGSHKLAIFVHGCYWHQCPLCNRNRAPKTNSLYWQAKFEANVERDRIAEAKLQELGYQVEIVWECQVRKDLAVVISGLLAVLATPSAADKE
jgi:DNA mismatch endonuclease (patch repair protein)